MTTFERVVPVLTYQDIAVAHSGLFVHVDDVDAHYERARGAGARIDSEPVDQPYGQREYGARDPEGHRWWFASPVTTRR